MKKKITKYILFLLNIIAFSSLGSEIRGIIVNKDKAVSFASVTILNSKIGTQADENGKFVIKNAPVGKQTIQISSIGYKTKQLTINILEEKTTI